MTSPFEKYIEVVERLYRNSLIRHSLPPNNTSLERE